MSEAATLYERDFYAWTQDQAAALRALPERVRPNALDVEHLAGEIEDLGISERRAATSLIRQILVHLLKLRSQPGSPGAPHWQDEVDSFRAQLADILRESPSLRARRAMLAAPAWEEASRLAIRSLARAGQDAAAEETAAFTAQVPYFDLDAEVLHPEWFPSRP